MSYFEISNICAQLLSRSVFLPGLLVNNEMVQWANPLGALNPFAEKDRQACVGSGEKSTICDLDRSCCISETAGYAPFAQISRYWPHSLQREPPCSCWL